MSASVALARLVPSIRLAIARGLTVDWDDVLEDLVGFCEQAGVPAHAELDGTIRHQAATANQAIVELVANAIDAGSEVASIGRFGVGFYQVLAEIESEKDKVVLDTARNGKAWRLVFSRVGRAIHLSARSRSPARGRAGTKVTVHIALSRPRRRALVHYMRARLGWAARAAISLNWRRLNRGAGLAQIPSLETSRVDTTNRVSIRMNRGGYTVTDRGVGMSAGTLCKKLLVPRQSDKPPRTQSDEASDAALRLLADLSPSEECRIDLLVSGIGIETLTATGLNLPRRLVLDLSGSTWLPESRNRVSLDDHTRRSFDWAVEQALSIQGLARFQVLNALASLGGQLAGRSMQVASAHDLLKAAKRRVRIRGRLDSLGTSVLPNRREFACVAAAHGTPPVFIDLDLFDWDPSGAGLPRVEEFRSAEFVAHAADLRADGRVAFKVDRTLYVDRELFKAHRDRPILFNLLLNHEIGYGHSVKTVGWFSKMMEVAEDTATDEQKPGGDVVETDPLVSANVAVSTDLLARKQAPPVASDLLTYRSRAHGELVKVRAASPQDPQELMRALSGTDAYDELRSFARKNAVCMDIDLCLRNSIDLLDEEIRPMRHATIKPWSSIAGVAGWTEDDPRTRALYADVVSRRLVLPWLDGVDWVNVWTLKPLIFRVGRGNRYYFLERDGTRVFVPRGCENYSLPISKNRDWGFSNDIMIVQRGGVWFLATYSGDAVGDAQGYDDQPVVFSRQLHWTVHGEDGGLQFRLLDGSPVAGGRFFSEHPRRLTPRLWGARTGDRTLILRADGQVVGDDAGYETVADDNEWIGGEAFLFVGARGQEFVLSDDDDDDDDDGLAIGAFPTARQIAVVPVAGAPVFVVRTDSSHMLMTRDGKQIAPQLQIERVDAGGVIDVCGELVFSARVAGSWNVFDRAGRAVGGSKGYDEIHELMDDRGQPLFVATSGGVVHIINVTPAGCQRSVAFESYGQRLGHFGRTFFVVSAGARWQVVDSLGEAVPGFESFDEVIDSITLGEEGYIWARGGGMLQLRSLARGLLFETQARPPVETKTKSWVLGVRMERKWTLVSTEGVVLGEPGTYDDWEVRHGEEAAAVGARRGDTTHWLWSEDGSEFCQTVGEHPLVDVLEGGARFVGGQPHRFFLGGSPEAESITTGMEFRGWLKKSPMFATKGTNTAREAAFVWVAGWRAPRLDEGEIEAVHAVATRHSLASLPERRASFIRLLQSLGAQRRWGPEDDWLAIVEVLPFVGAHVLQRLSHECRTTLADFAASRSWEELLPVFRAAEWLEYLLPADERLDVVVNRWVALCNADPAAASVASQRIHSALQRRWETWLDDGGPDEVPWDAIRPLRMFLTGSLDQLLVERSPFSLGRVLAKARPNVDISWFTVAHRAGLLSADQSDENDVLGTVGSGFDLSPSMREVRSAVDGQDQVGFVWVRQLIQNSIDAHRGSDLPRIEIESFRRQDEWGLSIKDTTGMSLTAVLRFLLPLDSTSSGDLEDAKKRFGQGFYACFVGADLVRLQTGIGDGHVTFLELRVHKDSDGMVAHVTVEELSVREGDLLGTEIERVQCFGSGGDFAAELSALSLVQAVHKHGGCVSRDVACIRFMGEAIADEIMTLGVANVAKWGAVAVGLAKSGTRRVLHRGMFLRDISHADLERWPRVVRHMLDRPGLTLTLPTRFPQARSRNAEVVPLAAETPSNLPRRPAWRVLLDRLLGKPNVHDSGNTGSVYDNAWFAAGARAAVTLHTQLGIPIPDLPRDYLYSESAGAAVAESVATDARRINDGELGDLRLDAYFGSGGQQCVKLLTLVRAADDRTLVATRGAVLAGERIDVVAHERFIASVRDAERRVSNRRAAGTRTDYGDEDVRASAQWTSFLQFCRLCTNAAGVDARHVLYKQESSIKASWSDDGPTISWNLHAFADHIETLFSVRPEGNPGRAVDESLYEVLETIAHELSHSTSQGWTHESDGLVNGSFKTLMEQWISVWIRAGFDPLEALRGRSALSGPADDLAAPNVEEK